MKNNAAELGPKTFGWWPDWRGECVAIVGSGVSTRATDLSLLRDRIHVIAIKTNIDLLPFAEVVYGCDAPWWIDRKGLPDYKGLKIFHGQQASHFKDMHRVEIEISKDSILLHEPMRIGNGGNSGFQAINLAAQFGAANIILIGFDCHAKKDVHWYGRNKWVNANNPAQANFNRWLKAFDAAKKDLDRINVSVINTCLDSEIKCFEKMSLPDAMREWGL